MRVANRIVCSLVLALAACGGSEGPARSVRVTLRHDSATVVVQAEVAATPADRARGLMSRPTVPKGTGMLFVFPQPSRGSFYMKNTLVPLTILFIRGGSVREVRDMQPCRADPCPLTTPAEEYDWALEVPQGSEAGIGVGALVEVDGRLPSPT